MRLFRLLPYLLVVAPWLNPRPAHGQTGTLTIGTPAWQLRSQTDGLAAQIDRQDCLDNASIDFSSTTTVTTGVYELWAGAGCDVSTNRTGASPTCVKVSDADLGDNPVNARVQDLVKDYGAAQNTTAGTETSCDAPGDKGENKRALWFVIYDVNAPTTSLITPSPSWPFSFDTVAPPPPTGVKAGSGESSLMVELTAPANEKNLAHYRFYCTPSESTDGSCSASVLVPGSAPSEDYYCGSVAATAVDSGTSDSKLTNGVNYALAIASEDSYGNVGVLSEVSCAMPQEVTGFYEAYRAAGGQAGGGFCSFGPARRGAAPLALALLLGALAFGRRRR